MADYFDEVEEEIHRAKQEDPEVVLPWSWWQQQGERHGMSPNAIYTRAVKVGLYVPPAKREGGEASSPRPPFKAPPPPSDRAGGPPEREEQEARRTVPSNGTSHFPQPGLGEAIQGFSALVERVSGLEQQVADLTRELTAARMENRRMKRILREMDGFAEKIRQTYHSALTEE
jgi:hypothetical protein